MNNEILEVINNTLREDDKHLANKIYEIANKVLNAPLDTELTIAEVINYNPEIEMIDPLSQGLIKSCIEKVCDKKGLELVRKDDSFGGLAFYNKFIIRKNILTQTDFTNNEIGYAFKLDSRFRELSKEEKAKYNISNNITTYLLNESQGLEMMISFDGFYQSNNLEEFYNLFNNNMINNNFQIINEEKFVSTQGINKTAFKLLSKTPSGRLQVSYFMTLTDNTEKGTGFGCITANPRQDHDVIEGYIIEVLNNWYYI